MAAQAVHQLAVAAVALLLQERPQEMEAPVVPASLS
jgi:hypothetical protein